MNKEEIEKLKYSTEKNMKIEYVGKVYDLTKFYYDYKEPAIMLKDMGDKIKEIIDYINKEEN